MLIEADINYFKKNSTLNVYLFSDFILEGNWGSQDSILYELRSSEFGDLHVLRSGDIAATFQYNNVIAKEISARLKLENGQAVYSGTYSDIITFVVEYEEIEET
jgi:hypothetical protein